MLARFMESVIKTLDSVLLLNSIYKSILDKTRRINGTGIMAKSARAVAALTIGTVAGRGMRFIRSMILARILAPNQIGMMAIIMSFSIAFEALTEVGVKQSIIQNKKGADSDYLNAAWWMQLVRGLCLFAVAFLLAPYISSYYDNPKLMSLLRVAFLAIALRGLVSPRAYVLEKHYKFGQAVFLNQGSSILGAVISVTLAFIMRNVWALVIGFVSETAILATLSFILVPFLPRFRLDRSSLAELMKFAGRIFGLPVLTMLSIQAPTLILGKVIPNDELGLYVYAYLFALLPAELFLKIIGPVLLPAFSEKQDDNSALRRGLLRTTKWTASFAIPLIIFMVCCSPELLFFAFGGRWVAMTIPFMVLCFQVLIRNEAAILASVYLAIAKPHLQRRFAVVRAVAIVGLAYPAAVHFGPLGVAAVIVLNNFYILIVQALVCVRIIELKFDRYVGCYVTGLLLAIPIVITFDLFQLFGVDNPIVVFVIGGFVCAMMFAAGALVLGYSKLRTKIPEVSWDGLRSESSIEDARA